VIDGQRFGLGLCCWLVLGGGGAHLHFKLNTTRRTNSHGLTQ
jgi:hypothetical protein